MAQAAQYGIETFVEDAKRILGESGDDRERVVRELQPLVEQVLWDDALFDEKYRAEPENERPRYIYHREPDDALQIYVVQFAPGMPTPVHDHVTWGLIGTCGGQQHTKRYERVDDGSDPHHAKLKLIEDTVLGRGAVYPLLPPNDIHSIETVGDEPSYSLHVLGVDLRRQKRNIYDCDSGEVEEQCEVTAVDGRGM